MEPTEQMPGSNRKLIFVVIGLLVLIIIVFISILLLNKTSTQPTLITKNGNESNEINTPEQLTNTPKLSTNFQVRDILLSFLSKQKDSKGIYFGQITCSSKGSCASPVAFTQSGPNNIWGRFKRYEINKNAEDLSIITKDIETYTNPQNKLSFQDYFYNCKLLNELQKSTLISTSLKGKMKDICFDSQPPSPVSEATPTSVNILDIMQKKQIDIPSDVSKSDLGLFATATSNFVSRTDWQKKDYIPDAKIYFNSAMLVFAKVGYAYDDNTGLLGVAALDLYGKTKDKLYLTFANFIYNTYGSGIQSCSTPMQCANMVYFIHELNNVSPKPQYRQLTAKLLDQMITISFDYKGYPNYKTGVGAFVLKDSSNVSGISVGDNGFIAGVLNF